MWSGGPAAVVRVDDPCGGGPVRGPGGLPSAGAALLRALRGSHVRGLLAAGVELLSAAGC